MCIPYLELAGGARSRLLGVGHQNIFLPSQPLTKINYPLNKAASERCARAASPGGASVGFLPPDCTAPSAGCLARERAQHLLGTAGIVLHVARAPQVYEGVCSAISKDEFSIIISGARLKTSKVATPPPAHACGDGAGCGSRGGLRRPWGLAVSAVQSDAEAPRACSGRTTQTRSAKPPRRSTERQSARTRRARTPRRVTGSDPQPPGPCGTWHMPHVGCGWVRPPHPKRCLRV